MAEFMGKDFLGRGWAFPVTPDASGTDIAAALHEEDIRQAIRLILETEKGERRMRADFGVGLRSMVFEPVTAATTTRIKSRVTDALTAWEPRIDLEEVKVTIDNQERNRVIINILYKVRSTNTFYNFVYPFYLQEAR